MTLKQYLQRKAEQWTNVESELIDYIRTFKGWIEVTYTDDNAHPLMNDGTPYEFDQWIKDKYPAANTSDVMKGVLRRTYFEPTTEHVDFENYEIESITDDKLVVVAGGDWQPPFRITVVMKDGEIEPEVESIVQLAEGEQYPGGMSHDAVVNILVPAHV